MTRDGSLAGSAAAGMLVNDVAVDADTGDAYFTDSFNCRACKTKLKFSLLVSYLVFVARHPYLDLGIMKVAMLSNALSDANVSTW